MTNTAWQRLGIYIRIAWRGLVGKIHLGSIDLHTAGEIMEAHFGAQGKIWTRQDLQITLPLVPPQPP